MHGKHLSQNLGLVSGSLAEADLLGSVEVIEEHGLVLGVGASLDDDAGTLAGRETTEIGESLLGHEQTDQGLVDAHLGLGV